MTDEDRSELQPNNLASSIDKLIGIRIRECRIIRGLTQSRFANLLGLTYQQAEKYERGINHVSVSLLYEIAQKLDAPIDFFFEGPIEGAILLTRQRMLLDLLRDYGEIHDEKEKEALRYIARVLAGRAKLG